MKEILLLFLLPSSSTTAVTLSNVGLPRDQHNRTIITGESDVLLHQNYYYYYANDWGDCPGVNCCYSSAGCASCCFNDPPHPYAPGCGDLANGSDPYGLYHTVWAYRTADFQNWENLGVALPLSARKPGTEFRPHVVYSKATEQFVMWFEDRGPGLSGYQVAVSSSPGGPFQVKHENVGLPGRGRVGDFDIFVDDDGSAYHVRTGFDVVRLNDDFTGPAEHVSSFSTPKASEGLVMFKRKGIYYVLAGTGCCACIGGSTIYVMTSSSVKGPWKYRGDVGSNPQPFDPHSPDNYVTKAQASAVFEVGDQLIWMGNQWNSGLELDPPGPRNHDWIYWTKLEFEDDGAVKQVNYSKSCEFEI